MQRAFQISHPGIQKKLVTPLRNATDTAKTMRTMAGSILSQASLSLQLRLAVERRSHRTVNHDFCTNNVFRTGKATFFNRDVGRRITEF